MSSPRLPILPVLCVFAVLGTGCRREVEEPPLATPAFSVNHSRAALGSPVEITYKWTVAPNAPAITENYRAMVHFLDVDEELMWTDDHDPAVPTSQWKPGQTIEYTRTMFVPMHPYIGATTVAMGLYSTKSNTRATLAGEHLGQRSYRVASMHLLPQTENVFLIYKDGWHPTEVAEGNSTIEWQWTKREATIAFRNPRKNCIIYLHVDSPGGVFEEQQAVDVRLADRSIDQFSLSPREELIRKIRLSAAELGSADMVELKIVVDKTFVPALIPAARSRDPRELGIRVFHAFVEPVP